MATSRPCSLTGRLQAAAAAGAAEKREAAAAARRCRRARAGLEKAWKKGSHFFTSDFQERFLWLFGGEAVLVGFY